jgi:hypothetical protein
MSKAGKLVKGMLKTKKESVMGQLGDAPYENPWEPWSSKYSAPVKNEEVQIDELSDKTLTSYAQKVHDDSLKHDKDPSKRSAEKRNKSVMGFSRAVNKLEARPQKEEVETLEEDSWLYSYIKSLGYNPKIMNFAQRSKYARSNAFKHWKQSHMERRPGQTAAMEETNVEETWHAGSGKHPMAFKSAYDKGKQWDEGPDKHAVHINGKKWKSFDTLSHATNVAKKIKGATVHKEEVEILDEAGTGLLMTYIKAKGLNPLTMDGNQRQAYSRSSEFKVFKQKHAKVRKEEFERLVNTYGADNLAELVMQIQEVSGMGERGDDWNEATSAAQQAAIAINMKKKGIKPKNVKEEADKADTVTMDIPLLIRVLEFAREDAKTDMDLHKVVENLIKMRDGGTLSMSEYDEIVSIKEAIEAKYGKNYQDMVKRVGQKAAQKPVDMKSLAARMQASYAKDKKEIKELKNIPDNMDADEHLTREDLRQWFSKTHPEGGWKRINSKGEAIGPCAREPGEPKPKCMSNEKRAQLSKKERAAAVAAKRKYDPVADRGGKGGKPVNVSNFGKGKINEAFELLENHIAIAMGKMLDDEGSMTLGQLEQIERALEMVRTYVDKEYDKQLPAWVQAKITLATDYIDTVGNYLSNKNEKVNEESEQIEEKNSPTNPALWSRAKSLARSKFDVYPSAYANGWASKWYKSKGGGWKSVKEDVVQEGIGNVEDSPMSATNSVKAMESAHRSKQMKSARMIKSLYKNKIKETLYDWEKDDKPNAKIVVKGGTTMTGQPRDTVEIEPVLRTRPNQVKPTV